MTDDSVATRPHIVVEEGPNPSTDFFVKPLLQAQGTPFRRFAFTDQPDHRQLEGAVVVFVRYIPARWRKLLTRYADRLAGVAFFMDDDLFDRRAFAGLPLRYRRKLLRLAWRHQAWLWSLGAQLWVSTPWLAAKYAHWQPALVEAQAPYALEEPGMQTVFYHGSASHRSELEWLYPVMADVLEAEAGLSFEVIGDRKVRRLFAPLPRVHVLHPMPWPAYQALLRRPGRTIGLAPMLDTAFNQARAPTKFFDITRAGAVGIYARGAVYERLVRDDHNGVLCPMEPEAWVTAIRALANDPGRRQRLLEGARRSL